ncbi:MAG: hypothetical protein WC462_03080 [archaeon]
MNFTKLLLALVSLALLFGCTQNTPGFSFNQPFQVKEGVTYQANDLSIRVISFTDSRCPSGVQCIWQGELGVNLQVNDNNVHLGEITSKNVSIDLKQNVVSLTLVSIDTNQAEIIVTSTPWDQVVCTMEAKICPDGSAVGREPPLCNFALCPDEK